MDNPEVRPKQFDHLLVAGCRTVHKLRYDMGQTKLKNTRILGRMAASTSFEEHLGCLIPH